MNSDEIIEYSSISVGIWHQVLQYFGNDIDEYILERKIGPFHEYIMSESATCMLSNFFV